MTRYQPLRANDNLAKYVTLSRSAATNLKAYDIDLERRIDGLSYKLESPSEIKKALSTFSDILQGTYKQNGKSVARTWQQRKELLGDAAKNVEALVAQSYGSGELSLGDAKQILNSLKEKVDIKFTHNKYVQSTDKLSGLLSPLKGSLTRSVKDYEKMLVAQTYLPKVKAKPGLVYTSSFSQTSIGDHAEQLRAERLRIELERVKRERYFSLAQTSQMTSAGIFVRDGENGFVPQKPDHVGQYKAQVAQEKALADQIARSDALARTVRATQQERDTAVARVGTLEAELGHERRVVDVLRGEYTNNQSEIQNLTRSRRRWRFATAAVAAVGLAASLYFGTHATNTAYARGEAAGITAGETKQSEADREKIEQSFQDGKSAGFKEQVEVINSEIVKRLLDRQTILNEKIGKLESNIAANSLASSLSVFSYVPGFNYGNMSADAAPLIFNITDSANMSDLVKKYNEAGLDRMLHTKLPAIDALQSSTTTQSTVPGAQVTISSSTLPPPTYAGQIALTDDARRELSDLFNKTNDIQIAQIQTAHDKQIIFGNKNYVAKKTGAAANQHTVSSLWMDQADHSETENLQTLYRTVESLKASGLKIKSNPRAHAQFRALEKEITDPQLRDVIEFAQMSQQHRLNLLGIHTFRYGGGQILRGVK